MLNGRPAILGSLDVCVCKFHGRPINVVCCFLLLHSAVWCSCPVVENCIYTPACYRWLRGKATVGTSKGVSDVNKLILTDKEIFLILFHCWHRAPQYGDHAVDLTTFYWWAFRLFTGFCCCDFMFFKICIFMNANIWKQLPIFCYLKFYNMYPYLTYKIF